MSCVCEGDKHCDHWIIPADDGVHFAPMCEETITRCKDDRPMFYNEQKSRLGRCMICWRTEPVVEVIYHDQMRDLCKPCTYQVINEGPQKWPG